MRRGRFFLIFLIVILTAAGLGGWTAVAERDAHYVPEYAQLDLQEFLIKEKLSEEDYRILWEQTGLARVGVKELYDRGEQQRLLALQERFFAPVEYECGRGYFICRSEWLTEPTASQEFLPVIQDGDILVTFNGHVFGWRSGHVGLVVDAEAGLVLEAITFGQDSKLRSLEVWRGYPGVALLRLKGIAEEEAAEVAEYALEELAGIPYNLACVCLSPKEGAISGTQCAHLVWLAYEHFGYDLDGDGGLIVTPHDLYESDLLEVIQLYGIAPE